MNKIKYTLCLLLFFHAAGAQTPNSWTRVADFAGIARAGAVAFSTDSFGYVGLGLYGIDSFPYPQYFPTDFWQYSPFTNTWMQKANFPGAGREYASSFVIGSKAYVGLGTNSNSPGGMSDFWEYDQTTDIWVQKSSFGGGQRYGCFAFSMEGMGYVGMGYSDTSGQYKKDIWEYDPSADTWTQLGSFPGSGVNESALFNIGGDEYIGFGFNSSLLTYMNDIWRYNPSSDSWSQLTNFYIDTINGRVMNGYSIIFSIGNKGYINVLYDSSGIYSNYFWEYNTVSDSWTQKDSFIGGLYREWLILL